MVRQRPAPALAPAGRPSRVAAAAGIPAEVEMSRLGIARLWDSHAMMVDSN